MEEPSAMIQDHADPQATDVLGSSTEEDRLNSLLAETEALISDIEQETAAPTGDVAVHPPDLFPESNPSHGGDIDSLLTAFDELGKDFAADLGASKSDLIAAERFASSTAEQISVDSAFDDEPHTRNSIANDDQSTANPGEFLVGGGPAELSAENSKPPRRSLDHTIRIVAELAIMILDLPTGRMSSQTKRTMGLCGVTAGVVGVSLLLWTAIYHQ
jgi:hypothetical protein